MHNIAILFGLMDGSVEATCYVARVDIAVTNFDGVCIWGWVHDDRFKILVIVEMIGK